MGDIPSDGRDLHATDPAWFTIVRWASLIAAAALLAASLLQAAYDSGSIGTEPVFQETDAGPMQDIADFYAAAFAYEHDVLWNTAARDTLFPVAFLAIIVVGLATRRILGGWHADAELMWVAFLVGGLLSLMNPLAYLAQTTWWRETGWTADPPENMVAIGRASEALGHIPRFFATIGTLVLAAGLVLLWRVVRRSDGVSNGIGVLALVLGIGLATASIASVFDWWVLWDVGTAAFGVVLGPLLLVWLGRALWQLGPRARSQVPAQA